MHFDNKLTEGLTIEIVRSFEAETIDCVTLFEVAIMSCRSLACAFVRTCLSPSERLELYNRMPASARPGDLLTWVGRADCTYHSRS